MAEGRFCDVAIIQLSHAQHTDQNLPDEVLLPAQPPQVIMWCLIYINAQHREYGYGTVKSCSTLFQILTMLPAFLHTVILVCNPHDTSQDRILEMFYAFETSSWNNVAKDSSNIHNFVQQHWFSHKELIHFMRSWFCSLFTWGVQSLSYYNTDQIQDKREQENSGHWIARNTKYYESMTVISTKQVPN